MVFSADGKLGPRCGMVLSESALDVETALDLGIGPRSGTNPRSESYKHTISKDEISFRKTESFDLSNSLDFRQFIFQQAIFTEVRFIMKFYR